LVRSGVSWLVGLLLLLLFLLLLLLFICLFEFSSLDLIVGAELVLVSEDADEAVTVKSFELNEPVVVRFDLFVALIICFIELDGIGGSSKLS
jgi:hypothetical protein